MSVDTDPTAERAVEFAVLKYMSDPARREPVNVGLIVQGRSGTELRFRGYDGSKVDGRSARYLVRDVENYRQWIDYLQWLTSQEGFEIASVLHERAGDSYLVERGGQTLLGEVDLSEFAEELYRRLVEPLDSSPALLAPDQPTFARRVDDLLAQAELLTDPHFSRDQQVSVGQTKRPFHYVWQNGSVAVGHRIENPGTDNIDALLFRFEHLNRNYRRVLFVDSFGPTAEESLRAFAEAAHDPKVFVVDETSPDEVHEAFVGSRRTD